MLQLVEAQRLGPRPGGIDQHGRDVRCGGGPLARHGEERHDARAAADEQQRSAILRSPGEGQADGATQGDLVSGLRYLVEEA